ncbi:MAG: GNAT family N-acetyltransferase [Actinomycetota bacterium]|nr:GNAT family N-acetyltransferase [Actinomycetota bacterium]
MDLAAMLAASVDDDGILGYARPPIAEESRAFVIDLEQMLDQGSGHVLIGTDSLGVVAMCVLSANAMPNCKHIAEVSKAYLVPRVRGTPAVFELANAVCEQAEQLGTDILTIDVRENSKAHRVWQRIGFTTYGILPDYSRVNGESFRGHYMWHSVADLHVFVESKLRTRGNGRCEPRPPDDVT